MKGRRRRVGIKGCFEDSVEGRGQKSEGISFGEIIGCLKNDGSTMRCLIGTSRTIDVARGEVKEEGGRMCVEGP